MPGGREARASGCARVGAAIAGRPVERPGLGGSEMGLGRSRSGALPRRAGVRVRLVHARRSATPIVLTALLVAASAPSRVGAQDDTFPEALSRDPESFPRPETFAVRTAERPVIDGSPDEALWERAPLISDFIQSQPDPGRPATERTEVRVLYDDEYLYFGVVCYDSDTGHLVVQTLERDFPGQSSRDADVFSITLDTFLDRRNSFIYLINPFGAVRDGQSFNDSRVLDFGWDGVVHIQTRILDDRWTVEVAIPWTSLRYVPGEGERPWGLNLLRRVRRKNEDSYWAPVDRRDPVHRMSKAGTLNGLRDLPANRNMSVKPYVLAESTTGSLIAEGEDGSTGDVGLDMKWGITPGMTLDLTVRTDFSQVEVDQERVNLTRFPLFFPEQRDFFLENSGSFTFGDVSERNYRQGSSLRDFTLFHSRRIGLQGGRPVPILGGARLSGNVGPFEVGILNMQTEDTDATPDENFTVLRARRDLFEGSDIGVMFINRQSTSGGLSDDHNRSVGVDANLRLLGGLVVNAYLATTRTPGLEGNENAGRVSVAWRDRTWDASAQIKQVGDAFNPEVGFVRRRDIRQSYGTVGVHLRPGIPHVLEVSPYVETDYISDLGGLLLSRGLTAGVGVDFLDGGVLGGSLNRRTERLTEDFEPSAGVTVPAGRYDFTEGAIGYESSQGRPLSLGLTLSGGSYFDGDRRSAALGGRWIASYRLTFDGSAEYNSVTLPGGGFTSNVYGARLKYGFSTRLFGSVFAQYNDATRQFVSNFRVNFIHSPLSYVYLVYTERRDTRANETLERLVTLKVTKYVSF